MYFLYFCYFHPENKYVLKSFAEGGYGNYNSTLQALADDLLKMCWWYEEMSFLPKKVALEGDSFIYRVIVQILI